MQNISFQPKAANCLMNVGDFSSIRDRLAFIRLSTVIFWISKLKSLIPSASSFLTPIRKTSLSWVTAKNSQKKLWKVLLVDCLISSDRHQSCCVTRTQRTTAGGVAPDPTNLYLPFSRLPAPCVAVRYLKLGG